MSFAKLICGDKLSPVWSLSVSASFFLVTNIQVVTENDCPQVKVQTCNETKKK